MQLIQLLTLLFIAFRTGVFKGLHLANPYHLDALWSPGRMVFRRSEAARAALRNIINTDKRLERLVGQLQADRRLMIMASIVEGRVHLNLYAVRALEQGDDVLNTIGNPFWRQDGRFVFLQKESAHDFVEVDDDRNGLWYNPYVPLLSYAIILDEEFGGYFERQRTAWA